MSAFGGEADIGTGTCITFDAITPAAWRRFDAVAGFASGRAAGTTFASAARRASRRAGRGKRPPVGLPNEPESRSSSMTTVDPHTAGDGTQKRTRKLGGAAIGRKWPLVRLDPYPPGVPARP